MPDGSTAAVWAPLGGVPLGVPSSALLHAATKAASEANATSAIPVRARHPAWHGGKLIAAAIC